MAAIDWAMCHHLVRCKHAMSHAKCPNNCLPHVIRPATSASIRTVQTVQSTPLFFACLSF